MKLTLINHACVKIQTETLGILCDPWVEGTAFNFGWDLLIPTPSSFDEIMDGVSLIWISHEHPDHFSVPFLQRVAKTHKDKVTILFQKTRDHRVVNFCSSIGLKYRELEDRAETKLNDEVSVTCGVTDFYDSWLFINDGKTSILNLNDCHTRSDADVEKITRFIATPTLLLSQFSYASWKGGKENSQYRAMAATQKMETLSRQIKLIRPQFTIPFASMIYFSNEENSYMNDLVNTPAKATLVIRESGSSPVVLYPGDTCTVGQPHDNTEALKRYEKCYSEMDKLALRPAGKSSSVEELNSAFVEYQKRVYTKNSRFLIETVSRISPLKAFQPLTIDLYDINAVYSFSVVKGMKLLNSNEVGEVDVRMHSSSFLFILKNDFGFDTLMVNGRLEASPKGFSKMTKSLAIGSLNAMGLSLSMSLVSDFRVILTLLKILSGVLAKLRNSEKAAPSNQAQSESKDKTPSSAAVTNSHADTSKAK